MLLLVNVDDEKLELDDDDDVEEVLKTDEEVVPFCLESLELPFVPKSFLTRLLDGVPELESFAEFKPVVEAAPFLHVEHRFGVD